MLARWLSGGVYLTKIWVFCGVVAMEYFWGSRLIGVLFDLDVFSLCVFIALLLVAAWELFLLFVLRLELGSFSAQLGAFSEGLLKAPQLSHLSSMPCGPVVADILKNAAREFFIGSEKRQFSEIRAAGQADAKRLVQAFGLVRDEGMNVFCSRVELALTIGWGISLLSACGIVMYVVMNALQGGLFGLASARADGVVIGVLLFAFLGIWSFLITVVMGGFLRNRLAALHYEFKRVMTRVSLLAEKKEAVGAWEKPG